MRRRMWLGVLTAGLVASLTQPPSLSAKEDGPEQRDDQILGNPSGEETTPEDFSDADIQRIQRNREHFGLASSLDAIDRAFASPFAMRGLEAYGMPLTEDELSIVDARQQFGVDVEPLLRWADRQPAFGGVAFRAGPIGGLDIFVTEEGLASEIGDRAESLRLEFPIRTAEVEVTRSELMSAVDRAWEIAPMGTHSIGIDVRTNAIYLEIDSENVDLSLAQEALELELGVPVRVKQFAISSAEACNDRQICWDPKFRPGLRLTMGVQGLDAVPRCTMAFHVRVNGTTDEQFLTAGHCSWTSSSARLDPHHYGFPGVGTAGRVGEQKASLYVPATYPNYGFDVARFQMGDMRTTDRIYGVAPSIMTIVGTTRVAAVNDYVCMSPSVSRYTGHPSGPTACGIVLDDWLTWTTSNACTTCRSGGAKHDIMSISGDSGAPIWYPVGSQARPTGVHNTSSGNFARIGDALFGLNATIATGPL